MTDVIILDQHNAYRGVLQQTVPEALLCEDAVVLLNLLPKVGKVLCFLDYQQGATEDLVGALLRQNIDAIIVVIGDGLTEQQIMDCVLAGAKGVQQSSSLFQYAERLINAVQSGEAWVSRKMVARLIEHWAAAA